MLFFLNCLLKLFSFLFCQSLPLVMRLKFMKAFKNDILLFIIKLVVHKLELDGVPKKVEFMADSLNLFFVFRLLLNYCLMIG